MIAQVTRIRTSQSIAFLIAIPLIFVDCTAALGQTLVDMFRPEFRVTDAPVYSVSLSKDVAYFGGPFEHVAHLTGAFGAVDAASGQVDVSWPKLEGIVWSIASDGAGGWYIGGDFSEVNGETRLNVARFLPDGALSDWNPDVLGEVRSLALSGDTLFIGGDFSGVGAADRENLAAFDIQTGDLLPWAPGVSGIVNKLAATDTVVYVGGWFTSINLVDRSNIAAIDVETGDLLDWDPSANSSVAAMLVSDGTLYVGGWFTSIGGTPRSRAAAFDIASGALLDWQPVANNGVQALARSGSTVYLGGNFIVVNGQSRPHLAAVDATTAALLPWNPAAAGDDGSSTEILAMGFVGGNVLIGGSFTSINGEAREHLAMVDATAGAPVAWTANAAGSDSTYVRAVAVFSNTIAAGGKMNALGAELRNQIAAIDIATGELLPWYPSLADLIGGEPYEVAHVHVQGTTVYISGYFGNASHPHPLLAAVDGATGQPLPGFTAYFMPPADPVEGAVGVMESDGKTLFLVCSLDSGPVQPGLQALDAQTGELLPEWPILPLTNIRTLELSGDGTVLYFGGAFTQPRNHAGSMYTSDGQLTIWNPDLNDNVNALLAHGGLVYLAGEFLTVGGEGGEVRQRLAAVDAVTGTVTSWDPHIEGAGTDYLNALARVETWLLAAGRFDTVGGLYRQNLTAIDMKTSVPDVWQPAPGSEVYTLAANQTVVVAGGAFGSVGGLPRSYLAAFEIEPPCGNGLDCNNNGSPDDCDILYGLSPDCNNNGVPDECDIDSGSSEDCNANGNPDECDIADGTSADCNNNGIPDSCDIASGTSDDCNANAAPDECEVAMLIDEQSGELSPIGVGFPQSFMLPWTGQAAEDVTLAFTAFADLSSEVTERIDVDINGLPVGSVFMYGAHDCPDPPDEDDLTVPMATFNDAIAGGQAAFITMTPSTPVSPNACDGQSYITIRVTYLTTGVNDQDQNGIPDDCECPADLDGDGGVGILDLLALLAGWGTNPGGPPDFDGDGTVGILDLLTLLANWGPCP